MFIVFDLEYVYYNWNFSKTDNFSTLFYGRGCCNSKNLKWRNNNECGQSCCRPWMDRSSWPRSFRDGWFALGTWKWTLNIRMGNYRYTISWNKLGNNYGNKSKTTNKGSAWTTPSTWHPWTNNRCNPRRNVINESIRTRIKLSRNNFLKLIWLKLGNSYLYFFFSRNKNINLVPSG